MTQHSIQENIQPSISGHVLILDSDTQQVLLDKHNAIHFENMSLALAQSISSLTTLGPIASLAFGNGAATTSAAGTINYLTPNVTGAGSTLYNQTYSKIVNNQDPNNVNTSLNFISVNHIPGSFFSDVIINCNLGLSEPAGQDAQDTATSITGTYVFNEMGLIDYAGNLLTHVIFTPTQKSANRSITVIYTLRISMI